MKTLMKSTGICILLLLSLTKYSFADRVRVILQQPPPNKFSVAGLSTVHFIIPSICTLTASVNNLLSGSYYFVIKHRNSIETRSANPVTISPSGTTYYDFTTDQSKAFGNNVTQSGTVWSVYSGDINQDGVIDAWDLSQAENGASVGLSGYVNSDVTGDNFVDASDLSIVNNNSAI